MTELKSKERKKNHLAGEHSLYLKQHEENPVDWRPWGEAAFGIAKERDVPLFVSVGYSTCRWCHVMERESFEDEECADVLNKSFVCVKVDREQRPDIDQRLMEVCMAMNSSCGWPLNVILSPDLHPFWAGTYLPKRALMPLASKVSSLWKSNRDEVLTQAALLSAALESEENNFGTEAMKFPKPEEIKATFKEVAETFATRFDRVWGGFSSQGPKFPSPHVLTLLLRLDKRFNGRASQKMTEDTLLQIRTQGLYDHLSGGFHRYATDREWRIPHFEKMLYDQAGLTIAYLEAYLLTGMQIYSETAKATFQYVSKQLSAPGNDAFYSAEDAESEGEEGKYYLWTPKEIRGVLGNESVTFLRIFGCQEDESEPVALHQHSKISDIAREISVPPETLDEQVKVWLKKLAEVRNKRVRPALDDNILTDWNSFMAASMAFGSRVLGDKQLADRAVACMNFILEKMRNQEDGTLYHHFKDGIAAIPGLLDDYSFTIWGLCEIYMATFDQRFLIEALKLAHIMDERFSDVSGVFFFTEKPLPGTNKRKIETADGAIPSGNSIALLGLLKLSQLLEDDWIRNRSEKLATSLWNVCSSSPIAHCQLLSCYDWILGPSFHVHIHGVQSREVALYESHNIVSASLFPSTVISWDQKEEKENNLNFQVCTANSCLPIVKTANEVVLQLLGK